MKNTTIDRINNPTTADNIEIRKAIIARVRNGEISLTQGQSELAAIIDHARTAGITNTHSI